MVRCKSCRVMIVWTETPNGKWMPLNADGSTHWESCPQRREWKRGEAMVQESFSDMAAPKPETTEYPK